MKEKDINYFKLLLYKGFNLITVMRIMDLSDNKIKDILTCFSPRELIELFITHESNALLLNVNSIKTNLEIELTPACMAINASLKDYITASKT